jgi:hypothetical protein
MSVLVHFSHTNVTLTFTCHVTDFTQFFVLLCGETTFGLDLTRDIRPYLRKPVRLYLCCKVRDRDNTWAPHVHCIVCKTFGRLAEGVSSNGVHCFHDTERELYEHLVNCYTNKPEPESSGFDTR